MEKKNTLGLQAEEILPFSETYQTEELPLNLDSGNKRHIKTTSYKR